VIHDLLYWLRTLVLRKRLERDLDDELQFHIEQEMDKLERAGFSHQEARRRVNLDFGGAQQVKEECRDARGIRIVEDFFEDVHHALRSLGRDPFLVLVTTLTLAVPIGANTALFSLADSILIRPLPYPNSSRIEWISERSGPTQEEVGAAPDYYYLRRYGRTFEDVAAYTPSTLNRTGVETPEQVDAATVSASFFRLMGKPPMLGTGFTPQDEGSAAPRVVVVSYAYWRDRLGSDPHILGKTIFLDREPRVIVGVMPRTFDFPAGAQMWLPLTLDESTDGFPVSPTRPIFTVSIVALRKREISPRQTAAEMRRLSMALRSQYKVFASTGFRLDLNVTAVPLQRHLTGDVRPALLALSCAAGLLLIVGCVNLAGLQLARAGSRQREFAVRLALGSGRGRVVRQMLTESVVLALPGGAAGAGLAWIAVRAVGWIRPALLASYPPVSTDLRVLLFTLALTLATAVLFGMTPALSTSGVHPQQALKTSALAHSPGKGDSLLRRTLVVTELGLSLVLLIGAGLLARSLFQLAHADLGFAPDHLLTFRVSPIGPLDRNYAQFYLGVLDRLRQLPLATSAALVSCMPLNAEDFCSSGRIRVADRPLVPFSARPVITNSLVSPDYLKALRVPLQSGRFFDEHDSRGPQRAVAPGFIAAEPVVVNETFSRLVFSGESPLGRSLVFGPDRLNITWTIIGVVGDVRGASLGAASPAMIYRCTCLGSSIFDTGFLVRTAANPKDVIPWVRQAVRAVDRDQPIFDVKTMEERRQAALAPERFEFFLACAFAIVSILLAAAGVFGMVSYLVARRTREIGIRVALGARPANVIAMIMGETAAMILSGIVLGLSGAWALTRYIRSLLHGVTSRDPATFLLMPALLALIVLIASFGPSLRAARVDPIKALREE
jgi:putative ABC transport system permease protein